MLMSVIMSSPGPLVVGLALLSSRSSTQIADFIRRSIELLAIILAFVVYCVTTKNDIVDEIKKKKYERFTNLFVSVAMVTCGIIMLLLAIFSENEEKGNVIPGLAIAILGVIANTIFWFKYKKLSNQTGNTILRVQSSLYRAKAFVDTSVVIALGVMLFSNNPTLSQYFDLIGTICVSVYLAFSGCKSFATDFLNKQ